jgi:hypothetical protein
MVRPTCAGLAPAMPGGCPRLHMTRPPGASRCRILCQTAGCAQQRDRHKHRVIVAAQPLQATTGTVSPVYNVCRPSPEYPLHVSRVRQSSPAEAARQGNPETPVTQNWHCCSGCTEHVRLCCHLLRTCVSCGISWPSANRSTMIPAAPPSTVAVSASASPT